MDTRRAPGSRDHDARRPEVGTDTVGVELIDLQSVAGRTNRGRLALALATVVGIATIAGLLLTRNVPADESTAIASATLLPPPTATQALPTPSSSPSPTRPSRSFAPIVTPRPPSWRWEPIPIAGLEGQNAHLLEIWSLRRVFIAYGLTDIRTPGDEIESTPFLMSSEDGRVWTRLPMPTRDFRPEAGVLDDDELWIVGYVGGDPFDVVDTERQAWTTSDGSSWERIDGLDGLMDGRGAIIKVAASQNGWIAFVQEEVDGGLGDQSRGISVRLSEDGWFWHAGTTPNLPQDSEIRGVVSDGSQWVVLVTVPERSPATVTTLRSGDGLAWVEHPVAQVVGGGAYDITEGREGFVIVGSEAGPLGNEPRAWSSAHGVNWTQRSIGMFGNRVPVEMTRIISTAYGYLAISSSNGEAWVSSDARSWQSFAVFQDPSPIIEAVATRDELIVAGAHSAYDGYVVLVGRLDGMRHN